jgi:zinc protease
MDRTKQPQLQNDFQIQLMPYNKHQLQNNCLILNFPYHILPVTKIQFIFPAGKKHQTTPLISSLTANMILEGTKSKSQQQIANEFDMLGASIQVGVNEDFATLSVYCLNKHVSQILHYIHHILHECNFPQEQLNILLEREKQQFLVNQEKVGYLARRQLFQSVLSNNHPYCSFAQEADFQNIQSSDLKSFYKEKYNLNDCLVSWTGSMDEETIMEFESLFGTTKPVLKKDSKKEVNIPDIEPFESLIHKNGVKQSAVFAGRVVPGYTHEDHHNLVFVNTLLGGYFGSRLMKNIREDKGYTYGIGSAIVPYQDLSMLMIATQVKAEHTQDTINEINSELERLINTPISNEELNTVKTYLMGTTMQQLDGPFMQSQYIVNANLHGVDPHEMLRNFLNTIRQIQSENIKHIAKTYYKPQNLFYSIAGENN